jgi:hypothetical protein
VFPVFSQATRNDTALAAQDKSEATMYPSSEQGKGALQSVGAKTNEPVPPSKPNSSPASYGTQTTAEGSHAKGIKHDKSGKQQTKQACIAATARIPESHLEEMGIAQAPAKRPIPEFIKDIISRYSRELGDSNVSTKSNITRAAKLYFFALDYIRDAQDDPQGFFSELLYEAKQAAYKVNSIRYRSAGNRPNRIPVFFTCLENRFELSDDELAYIRSDGPLLEPSW